MAVSEPYIQTADTAVQDILYDTLYNMSFLLNDYQGKIIGKEATFILRNLVVNPTGVVQGIDKGDLKLNREDLLGVESFNGQLSRKAIALLAQINVMDNTLVETVNFNSDTDISDLFITATDIPAISPHMSYLYLELFAMYQSAVQWKGGQVFAMSTPELATVISNSRYVAGCIEQIGDTEDVYATLHVVRQVQRAILFLSIGIPTIL